MLPAYKDELATVYQGDCLEVLCEMPDASVDAVVTDPPAGIGFMGKDWDSFASGGRKPGHRRTGSGNLTNAPGFAKDVHWEYGARGRDTFIAFMTNVMSECLRVLKPGGHALVWAIPRTSHWTATAVEDAGFEVRDFVCHHFGSGFPKSLDVSKAIDKAAGAEREVVGLKASNRPNVVGTHANTLGGGAYTERQETAPATDAAKQWQGWGTALKPATEIWWLARKPLAEPTVASQVLATGTGALNIDACRVAAGSGRPAREVAPLRDDVAYKPNSLAGRVDGSLASSKAVGETTQGRWPANLVLTCCGEEPHLDGCPVAELDRQSGVLSSGSRAAGVRKGLGFHGADGDGGPAIEGNQGGASRFYPTFRYTAKASGAERNAGLFDTGKGRNLHPTVKPVDLMRWLCRLITPLGGIVLDPFAGSGTTLLAAKLEGFRSIGIEKEPEHVEIIKRRLGWGKHQPGLFTEAAG